MSDGLRLMPVKAKVMAVNRQIRRHSQFFAGARSQQCAIVTNSQAETAFLDEASCAGGMLANLRKQGEFTSSSAGYGMDLFYHHLMRI